MASPDKGLNKVSELDKVFVQYKSVLAEKMNNPDFLHGFTANTQQSPADAMAFLEEFIKK